MTHIGASATHTAAEDWLAVGKVVAVQGLKGELRINPASEFPERFTEPGTNTKAEEMPRNQAQKRLSAAGQKHFVVRFEGIESRGCRSVGRPDPDGAG